MKSKASVLKNGDIQYYSRMFDLYFVTEKQEYSYKGKKCNRLIYYILGKGKHRKADHRLKKISRILFNEKLAETKQFEEWGKKRKSVVSQQADDKDSNEHAN